MDNRTSSRTSTRRKDNINSTIPIMAPASKSSFSIPTSSSSSPIPIALGPVPPCSCNSKYSMEEVWKDITCPSTLHQPANTSSSTAALEGILFQEFLSRPSRAQYYSTSHHHHHHPGRHSSLESTDRGSFGSHSQGQPAPAAAASTALSLNSTRPPPSSSFSRPLDHDLDADANLNPPTVEFSILPKKRAPQGEDTCHRNKRMIKNRESAARSRARKQAYTNELEIKVARLMEENAKLRRQQEKLCLGAPALLPKKHMLCRTLTAPF